MENITFVRPAYFIIGGFAGIPKIKYYIGCLFFIYIVAVIGNMTVIIVLILDHTLRSPKHVAVFNLAFTDLLCSSVFLPKVFDIFLFNNPSISFNDCLTLMFFCLTLISMQSLNLLILAIDRLIAILFPLHYHVKVTHKFMLSLIVVFWLFASTVTLIAVGLLTRLSFCGSVVVKSYTCDHGPVLRLSCGDRTPNTFITRSAPILVIWIPLALILGSYCGIFYALSKVSTVQGRLKAFQTCTSHLSLLTIYYLPIIFVFTFGHLLPPNVRTISLSLVNIIPAVLNPFIYVLQTSEMRKSLKRLLKIEDGSKARVKV